ncbi:MAG TPA: HEAT repeat domain-containing protein, partial [Planctomycetota bacterium]|nr:HEAT repeat domain-containing protein [Planctomycetota bacterium]
MLIAAFALLHLSACSPQDPRLHLPPKDERPGVARQLPPTDSELSRFQHALLELHTFAAKQELLLQKIGQDYRDLDGLMVTVARKAGARELQQLMLVARRYGMAKDGSSKIGEELLFQALARPLGEATRDVLATMVQLKDKTSKQALFECVRGRVPGTRRQATEMLRAMLTVDDLPFALQLAGESSLDLQLAGVELLGSLKDERSQRRLLEVLAKEPAIAGAACTELIHQGTAAVPVLQAALQQPPIDRGFAYAAFALARIGEDTGQPVLPEPAVDRLRAQLDARDAATRSLCAIALADLAFHSGDADAQRYRDTEVVEALLQVVAPTAFVPNLDLLRRPAEARLVRLAGRSVTGDARLWRDWWADQKATFVAVRLKVHVDAQNAANAVVSLRGERSHLRLLGEGLAALAPLEGADELLLGSAQMLLLVQGLQAAGFMDPAAVRVPDGVAVPRSLQVQVPGGRALLVAPAGHERFDRMVAVVDEVLRAELWQLYRDPEHEPDRGAFWRSERRWLDANPEPLERDRRFLRRVVRNWPQTSDALRTLAVQQLFALPGRKDLLGEDDGKLITALVRAQPTLGERELRLLELAAGTPGDVVWRECIEVAFRAPGGGRPAVARIFLLLGAERVLAALDDERLGVKLAALDEAVRMPHLRAGPRLLKLLDDADADVRRTAAYAIGATQSADARPRLIELIAANDTAPLLRRECLHSLGRIGGAGAFEVLQRAIG